MVECDHLRAWRVFFGDGRRLCSRCGAWLPPDASTPIPPPAAPENANG